MTRSIQPCEPPVAIRGIEFQYQPTDCTCVHACLAMCLGVPVLEVVRRYGETPLDQPRLQAALTECGVLWNQMTHGCMVHSGWYFAVVPSLNRRGHAHQVLLNWSFDDGLVVLDPSRRRRYRLDGRDLTSWNYLTPFIPGGQLRIHVP
jgi:hypothetical protein